MPEITEFEEKIAAVETEISEVKAEIVYLKGGRDWRSGWKMEFFNIASSPSTLDYSV